MVLRSETDIRNIVPMGEKRSQKESMSKEDRQTKCQIQGKRRRKRELKKK